MQQLVEGNLDELFRYTSGPRNARILLVGEAWGAEEEAAKRPFVGAAGKELDSMLSDAGLSRGEVLCTNLVHLRPLGNNFTHFLHPTPSRKLEKLQLSEVRGVYPKPELQAGLRNLHHLVEAVQPTLILACGNWPFWALSSIPEATTTAGFKTPKGIAKWRGSQLRSLPIGEAGKTFPLLPLIHPAAILREYGFRAPTVHDLRSRAKRFLAGELKWDYHPSTFTFHKPTWPQIENRLHRILGTLNEGSIVPLAVDLETWRRRFISVVGLADRTTELCVPLFYGENGKVVNYLTPEQEVTFWTTLKQILEHPNVRIIGQNFIYDTEWLYRYYNITAVCSFDTMVAHHLLFPGTPKRLDYLASLYCNHYIYWKDESRDWDQLPEDAERYWRYNCKDTRATYEIAQTLQPLLKQQGMEELYAFQMEQWNLSRDLALKGIAFNSNLQREMRLQLLEEANQIADWLLHVVPESWQYASSGKPWYDSPTETSRILYQKLGLTPVLHKKTKKPTTDDSALAELSERSTASWLKPMLDRLRHLRSLGVFTRNFLEAKTSPDKRIRASFNIAHPETFRWSSNSNGFGEGMNFQNIPKGDKELPAEALEIEPSGNYFPTEDPDV